MANTFRQDHFKPTNGLTNAVVVLFAVLAAISLLSLVFSIAMITFPDAALDLGDEGSVNIPMMGVGLLALVEFPLRIGTAIVFLIWVHRSYGNLSALKATNLEFTPGWAVGWWFVPFLNIYKPFRVMRELYVESDPDAYDERGFSLPGSGSAENVGLWWTAFVISGIAFRLSDKLFGNGDEPASNYFAVAYMTACILSSVAAVFGIFVVREINRRQSSRATKIVSYQPRMDVPPPPPVFNQGI